MRTIITVIVASVVALASYAAINYAITTYNAYANRAE